MEIVIGLVIGLAVGAVVALIVHRQASALRSESLGLRAQVEEGKGLIQQHALELREAQTQLEDRGQQVQTLTAERDEARRNSESLSAVEATRANLSEQLQTVTAERDQARLQLEAANAEVGRKATRLAEVEADHTARQEELETYRAELEDRFKGIATNVTQSTREDFIKEFRDLTNQQSDSSLELMGNTVKPVGETLERLQKRVGEMEEKREGAYQRVEELVGETRIQIGQLRETTGGLRQALSSPQQRGRWGELTLERVLEVAGMREHVNYSRRPHVVTDDQTLIPDAVIHLPRGLAVPVDAKTPLDAYLRSHETNDDAEQRQALELHARTLMQHARTLGSKGYAEAIEGVSPDFVVLFVPTETILDAAMIAQPGIWEDAWSQHRVLIASPGLLIALLRTVGVAWQQEEIQQNAREIADAAKELYTRLGTYSGHLNNVGNHLRRAVEAHSSSVGSFQSRVLPQARRMEELGAIEDTKQIEEPTSVTVEPRQLIAPELEWSNEETP